MSNKINGKFYPLQHEEWVELYSTLTKSQGGVLIYLRTLDPYSNGIRVKSSKIAADLKITKRAVNSAIAVLAEKNLIEVEDAEYYLKVNSLGNLCQLEPSVTRVGSTVPTWEEDFPPGKHGSHLGSTVPTREEDFPLGKHSSHLGSETLTQQGSQNSKNIKINKIQLDPSLDPEAEEKKSKSKPNDQELNSNNQELIPNNSLRLKPGEDSSCKQNSLSRSIVPQLALPISAYDRWAATAHPALIFDGDRTPWLVPPQGKTFIRFLEEFTAWGASEFMREYGKSDFYKARADFRSYLLNHPDKVEDKWEQYCSQVTHKAVVMASRVAGGVSVEPEEFQFLLENNQAIANPELLHVDSKVLESVIPQGAEGVASYQLYSSDATQFWRDATEKCSRKMPQVAPCEVPKPELEWLNELIHSGNKSLVDMAVRKAKARGYSINQDGDCIYSITVGEG